MQNTLLGIILVFFSFCCTRKIIRNFEWLLLGSEICVGLHWVILSVLVGFTHGSTH